jgi:hypothetical protein
MMTQTLNPNKNPIDYLILNWSKLSNQKFTRIARIDKWKKLLKLTLGNLKSDLNLG